MPGAQLRHLLRTHVPWGNCPPPGLVLLVLDGPWVDWVGCALLMALGRWPLGTQAVSLSPAHCGWPGSELSPLVPLMGQLPCAWLWTQPPWLGSNCPPPQHTGRLSFSESQFP